MRFISVPTTIEEEYSQNFDDLNFVYKTKLFINQFGVGVGNFSYATNDYSFIVTGNSLFNGNVKFTGIVANKLTVRSGANTGEEVASFEYSDGQRIFFVPKNMGAGYNYIASENDKGIFWSDGLGTSGHNQNAGFDIAPWSDATSGIRIAANGNVGIGTATTYFAKLTVKGIIRAEDVFIKADVNVPDYVFAKDYDLRTLTEVENYVKENHHLPEIPSAKDFEKDGHNLGKMDMQLLKKVEELTLYIIEQNKQIEALKKDVQNLKK